MPHRVRSPMSPSSRITRALASTGVLGCLTLLVPRLRLGTRCLPRLWRAPRINKARSQLWHGLLTVPPLPLHALRGFTIDSPRPPATSPLSRRFGGRGQGEGVAKATLHRRNREHHARRLGAMLSALRRKHASAARAYSRGESVLTSPYLSLHASRSTPHAPRLTLHDRPRRSSSLCSG
jgi:hypothetical protein